MEYTPGAIRIGMRDLMGESSQEPTDIDMDPVQMKKVREEGLPILTVDFIMEHLRYCQSSATPSSNASATSSVIVLLIIPVTSSEL